MSKVFEDYFAELQSDMVSIALEYANGKANYIYIYASYEGNMLAFDVFYNIDEHILHIHKLNDVGEYDVSSFRQRGMLKIGLDDLEKIIKLCKEYDRDMPTEIKLIYNVQKNSLDAEYSYDLKYSNTKDLIADDIFNQWFEEVKKENGQK